MGKQLIILYLVFIKLHQKVRKRVQQNAYQVVILRPGGFPEHQKIPQEPSAFYGIRPAQTGAVRESRGAVRSADALHAFAYLRVGKIIPHGHGVVQEIPVEGLVRRGIQQLERGRQYVHGALELHVPQRRLQQSLGVGLLRGGHSAQLVLKRLPASDLEEKLVVDLGALYVRHDKIAVRRRRDRPVPGSCRDYKRKARNVLAAQTLPGGPRSREIYVLLPERLRGIQQQDALRIRYYFFVNGGINYAVFDLRKQQRNMSHVRPPGPASLDV